MRSRCSWPCRPADDPVGRGDHLASRRAHPRPGGGDPRAGGRGLRERADRRVPVPATGDEIDRLARTMNEMLDRLEASAHRQRAFVADASHELRSPMTVIRTSLEVGLARPEATDWPVLARGWLAQQGRLERLVDDLLVLARADEARPVAAPSIVDIDDLVLREARDLHARSTVHIDVTQVSGGRVRGDAEQLRRDVANRRRRRTARRLGRRVRGVPVRRRRRAGGQ